MYVKVVMYLVLFAEESNDLFLQVLHNRSGHKSFSLIRNLERA